jgi:dihydrofolate reductase
MKITAIVTCNKFGGMSQGNRLPWPELYFGMDNWSLFVGDNPVLIGYNTYRNMYQIKHMNPSKKFYVYTKEANPTILESMAAYGKPEDVIEKLSKDTGSNNLFIAGGLGVFNTFYDLIDEWNVTILEEHQYQYDMLLPLEKIKQDWPVATEITHGVDHYQHFVVMKYSKF